MNRPLALTFILFSAAGSWTGTGNCLAEVFGCGCLGVVFKTTDFRPNILYRPRSGKIN